MPDLDFKRTPPEPYCAKASPSAPTLGLRPRPWTPLRMISLSFLLLIMVGTALLCLPWATTSGQMPRLGDALFTATSAVCVTGLVVQDTATFWSPFGQTVILLLIQLGGLGLVSMAGLYALLFHRKIGIAQRSRLQVALGALQVGGVVKLVRLVLLITFVCEGLGALVLSLGFVPLYGLSGLFDGLFHAISAFCNAGFDRIRGHEAFDSLTEVAQALPWLLPVLSLLIVIGGLGFLSWEDLRRHGLRFRRYRLQTKVVLLSSLFLILLPALYFYAYEGRPGGLLADFPPLARLNQALFLSISPRTAGFNAVDLARLAEPSQVVTILLMLVGGASGSTAGGIKIMTVVLLLAATVSTFERREGTVLFKRRISPYYLRQALAITVLHIGAFLVGGLAIALIEGAPVLATFFESASAIGTVGLSLGLTPSLGPASRLILILLMYMGRVGSLTLLLAALSGSRGEAATYPEEAVTVG